MARRIILTTKTDEMYLRQISKPVQVFDDKLHTLLDDMLDTMLDKKGVGLAAPQIGILKRLFIIDSGDGKTVREGDIIEFVNPEILKQSGINEASEGCLSIPGESAVVARPKRVSVRAQDRNGEYFTLKTSDDLMCAAICHELDHLNGVLYTDKIVKK